MSNLTAFGLGANKSFFEPDGKLHFEGTARVRKLQVYDSLNIISAHQCPLGITSLAVANGIATDGMDTAPGATRRMEIVGIDGGINVKGRLKATYTQEDTVGVGYATAVRLNTTNATWTQAGEWRIILDILSGDVTGTFTVFMPPFSMMEYSSLEVYVTCDGATYSVVTSNGYEGSLAGPSAATENISNDESAGSDVVIEVASTTGFYEGNQVFVSDSAGSEWARIKTIVTDTSITVDTLTNSYTTANGAKLEIPDYIKTVHSKPIQRGMFRSKWFKPGENSGITFQVPIDQGADPDADILVVLQYIPTDDNAGADVTKWRLQYLFKTIGDDIPQSMQYGELAYADITPPTSKMMNLAVLATIPAATHQGDNLFTAELVRLGADSGDTYAGEMKFAAIVTDVTMNRLGYEV